MSDRLTADSFQQALENLRARVQEVLQTKQPFVVSYQNPCLEQKLPLLQMFHSKKAKHPNRWKTRTQKIHVPPLDHMKRGRVYKLTFKRDPYSFAAAVALYKEPLVGSEYRIAVVESGVPVIFLGRESSGHGEFFKVVVGDQTGYIKRTTGMKFKRYTARMLRRQG